MDNNDPFFPDENAILNQSSNHHLKRLNNKNNLHKNYSKIDNESDCYSNESKTKFGFQSSFIYSFNFNNKLNFSEENTENLKLFCAENSDSITLKNMIQKKIMITKKQKQTFVFRFQALKVK